MKVAMHRFSENGMPELDLTDQLLDDNTLTRLQ